MKTKCIIVDDEPLAINVIKNHLQYIDNIEIIAECRNALEASNILQNKNIDLIFLDIQMPKITGFEFLKSLNNPPSVIITTAFRNYAIKSYDFDVVDYLLKPIPFERFLKAVNKFFKYSKLTDVEVHKETDTLKDDLFIYVNEEKNIHKIYLKEIIFIESFREYIKIHLKNKSVTTKIQISKIEEKLTNHNFIRVHKSYIIPIFRINNFNARNISIEDNKIPIGRTYKEKIMKILKFDPDLL